MKLELRGLTCANCSSKIEKIVNDLPEVKTAEINLLKQEMRLELLEHTDKQKLIAEVEKIVHRLEPHVEVLRIAGKGMKRGHGEACSCGHDHGHEYGHAHGHDHTGVVDKKKIILQFGGGIAIFLGGVFVPNETISTILYMVAYLIFGYEVLLRAVKNIAKGQIFDENFLMALATIGAIFLGELAEAVFVMLFYQVGEGFQEYAVARSKKSIQALLEIRPDFAMLVDGENVRKVEPDDVRVGDLILVRAGERIPLDGTVENGMAQLDTAALTGESLPRNVEVGSAVLSGSINLDGNLKIRVTKEFAESTVMKILEMTENAAGKKSKTERFITKFAAIYTPIVVFLAVALAVVPPLLGMGEFTMWFGRALVFLMVSCPCALVLSVPLSYFAGIGAASSNGILVKGGGDLDTLCEVKQIVFDKTGTLTKGEFSVIEISAEDKHKTLTLAAQGERHSNHPIAKAIVTEYLKQHKEVLAEVSDYKELGGLGISYQFEGEEILLGNGRLLATKSISYAPYTGEGTVVYVAKGSEYIGFLVVADTVKENCEQSLKNLHKKGIQQLVMLTGDRKETASLVAKKLGIDQVFAELLPQNKLEIMDQLREKATDYKIAFVGDGINDAPVLAGADLGIAMGGIGSDAAIEAADVVLMDDNLDKLSVAIRIAKNTRKIVRQNIVFALGVKIIVLAMTTFGFISMGLAVFADVGVAIIAVLNAMRRK